MAETETSGDTESGEEVPFDAVRIAVPAHAAALAWINAFQATGQDETRPVLFRTLCLEVFLTGLHFIGCDGAALFRTWVPSIAGTEWPHDATRPLHTIVVMDPDGFGLGFMRALLRVTGEDEHQYETLSVTTAPTDDAPNFSLGEEFLTERVTLRACGQRIDLRLYDGGYPAWRRLSLGIEDIERVDGMTVATRMFQLVGKLKGVSAVDLAFFGDSQHVAFTARGDTSVRGILMPMRRVPERSHAATGGDEE